MAQILTCSFSPLSILITSLHETGLSFLQFFIPSFYYCILGHCSGILGTLVVCGTNICLNLKEMDVGNIWKNRAIVQSQESRIQFKIFVWIYLSCYYKYWIMFIILKVNICIWISNIRQKIFEWLVSIVSIANLCKNLMIPISSRTQRSADRFDHITSSWRHSHHVTTPLHYMISLCPNITS